MMDKEHLHLLIHEEIYQISEEDVVDDVQPAPATEAVSEAAAMVKEPEEPTSIHVEKEELEHPHQEETPKIPDVHHEEPAAAKIEERIIPFAVFHEASEPSEVALLQKIIAACKLENDHYQVFANGFNKEVKFHKALVFIPEAKAFYIPIPYKDSQFLCSKPLSLIANDVQEKAKLWGALQQFL